MKPAACLILALSLAIQVFGQSNTHTQRIDLNFDLGYRIDRTGSDLVDVARTTGFGAGADYSIGSKALRMVMSPYIHAQSGNDFNDMKSFYKDKGYTLSSYNGGMYYSTGMLFGARYQIPTRRPSGLPAFYTALQFGFHAAHTPATDISYQTIDEETITIKDDASTALGSNWRLQVGADVLRSGEALYSIQLSVRQERSVLPIDRQSIGIPGTDSPQSTEVFQWNGMFAVIGIGVAFDLE
jgi:hypothetical protein